MQSTLFILLHHRNHRRRRLIFIFHHFKFVYEIRLKYLPIEQTNTQKKKEAIQTTNFTLFISI
jgi:hypothetical protein